MNYYPSPLKVRPPHSLPKLTYEENRNMWKEEFKNEVLQNQKKF